MAEGGWRLKCRAIDEKMVDKRGFSLGSDEDVRGYFGKQGNFSPKVGVFCLKVLLFCGEGGQFLLRRREERGGKVRCAGRDATRVSTDKGDEERKKRSKS